MKFFRGKTFSFWALIGCLAIFAGYMVINWNAPGPGGNLKFKITMEDGGIMEGELYADVAPITVENFVTLVEQGFYDGLTFHRIIPGFMIQGGDPDGTGGGGPGHTIKGEFTENGVTNKISHTRGVLSMARSLEPDSAGSQFFIMHADNEGLDGKYAAFGKLTAGLETLDKIAETPTTGADGGDKPLEPVVIKTIEIVR